ncbi:MAG: tripartite tricarboxylate transporter permease, partial [Ignavibacteria bacterium]|nr:tripartite tricarboxylate transporter permease [Ignavibacteria bacterium]
MFEPGGFLNLYAQGIPLVFQFNVIIALIIGTTIGIIFGVIPGLSATIGVAIFTPLTFTMSTSVAFAVLLGIYCGSVYGGSISAILVNIPGTAASVMTKLDGHPLAQKGEAGRAIGLATTSSFIGGVISVFLLAFFAPKLANFALRLSAQEYFAICLFGISIIAYISDGSPIKGLISGIIGLLLATVG